jgi:hypothetical protein
MSRRNVIVRSSTKVYKGNKAEDYGYVVDYDGGREVFVDDDADARAWRFARHKIDRDRERRKERAEKVRFAKRHPR